MAKIDIKTNIPLVGTVKYVDWFPAREVDNKAYGAQVRLKGTWAGADGEIYLPGPVMGNLLHDGLAEEMGEKEHNGVLVPQYKWLHRGDVQVLKAQEGKTTRTSVLPLGQTAAPATNGQPPKAATNGTDPWAALGNTYARARRIAAKVWEGTVLDDAAMVAAVATVFIEANKRGLVPHAAAPEKAAPAKPAPVNAPPPRESFEDFPEALLDEDDELPFDGGR